jgi:hypothetical protein
VLLCELTGAWVWLMDVIRFWFILIVLFCLVFVFGTVVFGCIVFLELDLHIVWRYLEMGLFTILEGKSFVLETWLCVDTL